MQPRDSSSSTRSQTPAERFGVLSGIAYCRVMPLTRKSFLKCGGYVLAVLSFLALSCSSGGGGGEPTGPPPPARVASVQISPDELDVAPGESASFTVKVTDANGNVLQKTVTWRSLDPDTAIVDQNGKVTGVAPGTTTVSAEVDGVTDTAGVDVSERQVARVEISPDELDVEKGESASFSVKALDANGDELTRTVQVDWKSIDTDIAIVDQDGEVTGVALGKTKVSAEIEGKIDTADVTVSERLVASVEISPDKVELEAGESATFTAKVFDSDGNELTRAVTWSSNDKSIATIDQSGEVTGVVAGSTTVSAEAGGETADADVEVLEPAVASVEISPDRLDVQQGTSESLTVKVLDADGNELSKSVAWSSDDERIAAVDRNGVVTGRVRGSTLVTAEVDEVSDVVDVSVRSRIAFVSLRDANFEIYVMNEDGSDQTNLTKSSAADDDVAWSPDATKIAFASTRDGNKEIYVMDADGSNVRQLTHTNSSINQAPTWSPSGGYIAFETTRDGKSGIYIMNADGGSVTRLTGDRGNDIQPAWSPDGAIAYSSDVDGSFFDIYTIEEPFDPRSSVQRWTSSGNNFDPAWSPDGEKMAFASDRSGDFNIYVQEQFWFGFGTTLVTDNTDADTAPSWDPSGQLIVFTSDRSGRGEIYMKGATLSSGVRKLTDTGAENSPDWGP